MRSIVSNSIYAKKDRNGPPSANQVTPRDEPRHAVCTHLPPSIPPFLLKQNLSPKDTAGSDTMKLKVSKQIYPLWAPKSFNYISSGLAPR